MPYRIVAYFLARTEYGPVVNKKNKCRVLKIKQVLYVENDHPGGKGINKALLRYKYYICTIERPVRWVDNLSVRSDRVQQSLEPGFLRGGRADVVVVYVSSICVCMCTPGPGRQARSIMEAAGRLSGWPLAI